MIETISENDVGNVGEHFEMLENLLGQRFVIELEEGRIALGNISRVPMGDEILFEGLELVPNAIGEYDVLGRRYSNVGRNCLMNIDANNLPAMNMKVIYRR